MQAGIFLLSLWGSRKHATASTPQAYDANGIKAIIRASPHYSRATFYQEHRFSAMG
jgi:hypothetical protein